MLRSAVYGTLARLTATSTSRCTCSCPPVPPAPRGPSAASARLDLGGRRHQFAPLSVQSDRPHPTRALIEILRENENITTARLWKEVQDRKEVSEGARAIPNKRQMKTLLKFMKKTHKVRAARTQRAKSFVYSLHPLYLRREQARGGGQAPSPG